MSNDGGSTDTDSNDFRSNIRRTSLLDAVTHAAVNDPDFDVSLTKNNVISSKENVRKTASNDAENVDEAVHGFSFDIRSSQDRLRSRRSLSPSDVNSGSLADVMKNLEQIKKQSPSKKIQPLSRVQKEVPSLPHPRSVERKSISERAREKRLEKRPNHNHDNIGLVATLSKSTYTGTINENIEPVPSRTFLQTRSPTLLMLDRQRRLSSLNADHSVDDEAQDIMMKLANTKEPFEVMMKDSSSFARLARQKRIQKRMSK